MVYKYGFILCVYIYIYIYINIVESYGNMMLNNDIVIIQCTVLGAY